MEWKDKIYHMRSLTIDRPYSYEMREAVKDGTAIVKTGEPKIIWLYNLKKRRGNRRSKIFLKTYGVTTLEEFLHEI